MAYVRDFIR